MKTFDETKEAISAIAKVVKELPESVQEKAFDLLVAAFLEKTPHSHTSSHPVEAEPPTPAATPEKRARKKTSVTKESFQIDKNLNLTGTSNYPSLRAFVEQKAPVSNAHFTVVAVYYLKKYLQIDKVNMGHIYTCYKDAGRKTPGNLLQNLYDVSSKKYGYIELKSNEDIGLPTRGESFVEHDLPVKQK